MTAEDRKAEADRIAQEVPRAGSPESLRGVVRNAEDVEKLYKALENAILRSFAEDAQRTVILSPSIQHPTQAEFKHRFRICEEFILTARHELGFSLDRTIAYLHHALRCKLDGVDWDPQAAAKRSYIASSS